MYLNTDSITDIIMHYNAASFSLRPSFLLPNHSYDLQAYQFVLPEQQ